VDSLIQPKILLLRGATDEERQQEAAAKLAEVRNIWPLPNRVKTQLLP
jgi:hypothetical protein